MRTVTRISAAVVGMVLLGAFASTASAQTIAIRGATIVPVTGPRIENGTIVIRGNKIAAVGSNVTIPAEARVIDATGKFVYPGMINAWTQVGLNEIGSVAGGNDVRELGDFDPAMAAVVAINPHSEMVPVARVNGITSVLSGPTGGRISGVAALIDLDGWTPQEMAVEPLAALVVNYPRFGAGGGRGFGGFFRPQGSPEERRRTAERQARELKDYLEQAKSYAARKARNALPRLDRQMEAMVPAITGEMPVIITANSDEEILGAIDLAEQFDLDYVIYGAREAWKVVDTLAAKNVRVVFSQILSSPGRDDPFDAIYAQPGVLAARGIKFAFSTGDYANSRNLPYNAAKATAYGLDPGIALKALTIWPAEFWGVDDRLGSIEVGKQADLFIADGDPLDVRTTVEQVFIRGRPVSMETRHTRLYDKFRAR
ncbi:MAG: amidohydrolase family protein [Gemmatimonadales bacterium]